MRSSDTIWPGLKLWSAFAGKVNIEFLPRQAFRFNVPQRLEEETSEETVRISGTHVLDLLIELLVYTQVVFAPWLFGSTDRAENWIMNGGAYLLGLVTVLRMACCGRQFRTRGSTPFGRALHLALGFLGCLFLVYVGASILNCRAKFIPSEQRFDYFDTIPWLPQTYDRDATLFSFLTCLAHACVFWSTWAWLRMGRPPRARKELIPPRVKRLLWVLSLNGTLLALESILQRISGTNKLLWLIMPSINSTPESQFGPYSYRSNGAQYLNLIWPAILGFWYWLTREETLFRRSGFGTSPKILLLPFAVITAAGPFVSASRGGAIVATLQLMVCALLLLQAFWRSDRLRAWGILGWVLCAGAIGIYLGWPGLHARLEQGASDSGRSKIYETAEGMLQDYPIYGTGLGTFSTVYQLYMKDPADTWQALAHDDYIETRATVGWVGFSLLLLALVLVALHWFSGSALPMPGHAAALFGVALFGCLLHARVDFPFQIYSIVSLFLLLCCILFASGKGRFPAIA